MVVGSRALLLVCMAFVAFGSWSTTRQATAQTKKQVNFNRDIQPILAKSCWPCHGPDPEPLKTTGNLRLDNFEGATRDRGGSRPIAPGSPDQSLILRKVSEAGAMRMPPPSSGLKGLTPDQINLLRKWIEEGAEYTAHWAYVPPKQVEPPIKKSKWSKNQIDLFLESAMAESDLKPANEADKATLIRRVSLTLTGLPPTPEQVSAFESDRSPQSYEKMVDRMLASPRYGEHQARYWLDAVRYADTHGLHIDNERAVYPYRDWVIRALNQDLSFRDFTIWQLAGDLLPKPSLDQRIATGYIRMNPTTAEGGVIEAEFLAKNTMDRVDTTATLFMGATLGCAKCHDHKYDPYTQKDYYSLYAFFNSTADTPLDGNQRLHAPVMKSPSPEQAATKASLETTIAKLETAVKAKDAIRWAMTAVPTVPAVATWQMSAVYSAKSFDEAYTTDFGPEVGKGAAWKDSAFKLATRTPALIGKPNSAIYLRTSLTASEAIKSAIRVGSDDGIRIWLNGKLVHDNRVARALTLDQDTVNLDLQKGENALLIKLVNGGGEDGLSVSIGDEASRRMAVARTIASKSLPTPDEAKQLNRVFLELGPATLAAKSYRDRVTELAKLEETIPFTYVAEELPKPRPTFVLRRGEYSLPGEEVSRAVPGVLGKLPPQAPKNRLGLAQWLVDPTNPLTARVVVNRIWQQHWGEGIVASSEDFGSMGEWPTHPELLDFLALRFQKDGWSLKRLHRLILTSAAYRQSAVADAAKRTKDPYNKLYARGPRFRLDAEVVRDSALFVSGLLVERPGGKGDKPYQPSGLWEAIAYPISDTARYVQDKGDALYRRSVYLFWKRTSPPPTMLLFDAPMRESCVVKRSRTNTPTQALVTMNETGFVEASRVMAERVMLKSREDGVRLSFAFKLATGRVPDALEAQVLQDLLSQQKKKFANAKAEALKLLKVGEAKANGAFHAPDHAAWTVVCNAILNLDETLTQH